jgi:outer membrane receptor protein involved in Fe transport
MRATIRQYLFLGGTLSFASIAAAQAEGEGAGAAPAPPESPTNAPVDGPVETRAEPAAATSGSVAGSEEAAAAAQPSAADSAESENAGKARGRPRRAATPQAKPAPADPGIEELEDLSLVDLLDVEVLGASSFSLPAEKAPNVSYRLDAKRFSKLPVRTLAQLLDLTVPGLVVGGNRFFGPVIAQRGAITDSNAKTVVMLDGHNLNQRYDYGYNLALALPLLGDLDAVEVVQGPGSILHGSGSITGYVNMLPKTGRSNPGLELSTEYGPFDDANTVEAGYGVTYGPSDANDLYIYGGLARAGGFTPDGHPWNRSRGIDQSTNIQGRLQPSSKVTLNWQHGRLHVKAQYVDVWSTHGAGASGEEPTGWHEGYLAVRPEYVLALAPKHELDIIAGVVLHESGFSKRDERSLVPNQPVTSEPGQTHRIVPHTQRESHYLGRLVYKLQAFSGHKIAVGGELGTREFAGNKAWFHPVERSVAFDSKSRWNELSAFGEDVIEWGNLLAAVGLRYDVIDFRGGYFVAENRYDRTSHDQVSALSPRVSVAYEFIDGLSARVAYQRGFRAADASNLQENRRLTGPNNGNWTPVGEFGGPTWTAPPAVVAPETVDSVDLNIHVQRSFRDVNLIGDINAHYQLFDQYILYNVGWRNAASRFSSVGGEVVGKVQTKRGDFGRISYAYSQPLGMDAETAQVTQLTNDDRSQWRLYYRHQIKLGGALVVPGFDKRLALGSTARYYSPLPAWNQAQSFAATADPTWDERARRDPLMAVSASVTYDVTADLQLGLLGQHLFHNGTPAASSDAGHPELSAVGLDERLVYVRLRAVVD